MKKLAFILLIFVLLAAAGCKKETGIVCNEPYIVKGADCCLDKDSNKICDSDETGITSVTLTLAQVTTTKAAETTTTTVEETGELNPAFFDIPDTLVLGIPFYTGVGDVPREFAATIIIPPIAEYDIFTINGTQIIRGTCHPGLAAGENSNFIYCTGKKFFADKVGSNGVVLRESGNYGITLILERTGTTVEIDNYRGGMYESTVLQKGFTLQS